MVRWWCHLVLWNCLHKHHCHNSIGTHLRIHIQAEIEGHSQNWKEVWEWKIISVKINSCLSASFLTWSLSHSEWSAWSQGHCCHFHTISTSEEISQNFHPSSQCNHILNLLRLTFLGNLHPWWWGKCWHMFYWVVRRGILSLPFLGRHLGMKVRKWLHLHLSRFLYLMWIIPRWKAW